MRRAVAFAAMLALAAGAAGARPECAHACSCVPFDAQRLLEASDAAVVGAVAERRTDGNAVRLVLDVERRLKGPVGERVEMTTGHPAMCGSDARPGQHVAFFLQRRGEAWETSVCAQAPPEAVAALPAAATGEEVADSFAEATAWVIAIVAVAAVGFFLLRRRFRPD